MARRSARTEPVRSHTGTALPRARAFRYELHVTDVLEPQLWQHAGAARFAYNQCHRWFTQGLAAYRAELDAGVAKPEVEVPWSSFSFINRFNAFKNGKADDSPVAEDGTRGLAWKDEVLCQDVFECAASDYAVAVKNWRESRTGKRKGRRVGFPRPKKKFKSTPSFRLRNRNTPDKVTQAIRTDGNRYVRVPGLGSLRIKGSAKHLRRAMEQGRFHPYSATISYRHGRWWISIAGQAAEMHPAARSRKPRVQGRHGMDVGVAKLAVVANEGGDITHNFPATQSLAKALRRLRRANKDLARATRGSKEWHERKRRVQRIHGQVHFARQDALHQLTHQLVTELAHLTVEDLNVAGMMRTKLARHLSDAALGELGRQLGYKAGWYGLELTKADRWYASSKTCSVCGLKNAEFGREPVFWCADDACGHAQDRDENAATNLARWTENQEETLPLAAAA
jgi:putative transposase